MSRRLHHLASLAIALCGWGCGGDAHDEAPPLGTAAAIAKAPPNATGAGVARPAAPTPLAAPTPIKKGGAAPAPHPMDPLAPAPPGAGGGGGPAKGTDL